MTAPIQKRKITLLPKASFAIGACQDYEAARRLVIEQWGSDALVIAGKVRPVDELRLLAATQPDGQLAAIAYYTVADQVMLLGAIASTGAAPSGAGSLLFDAVVALALEQKLKKLRAVTTNDNFAAMKFFQQRGMRFMTLFPGGMNAYRAFKPGLRSDGQHGIPCRDMLELEMDL
jgi:N-acetylglutamate synthase-like GNAT family acetyltransferase